MKHYLLVDLASYFESLWIGFGCCYWSGGGCFQVKTVYIYAGLLHGFGWIWAVFGCVGNERS